MFLFESHEFKSEVDVFNKWVLDGLNNIARVGQVSDVRVPDTGFVGSDKKPIYRHEKR